LAAATRGDYETALKPWRPLAEQGDAVARYKPGLMYNDGVGVSQDYAGAVEWFSLAAGQGYARAEVNLAELRRKAGG
jgi:TPR repeat protein